MRYKFLSIACVAAAMICAMQGLSSAEDKAEDKPAAVEQQVEEGASQPESIEEQLYFTPEDLVTGAGKREMKLGEAPANVTVITHEEIMQSGQLKIPEILRRVPGMDVIWLNSAEDEVSLRGFAKPIIEGSRISVLIDGRTFYHEFISGTVWTQIPVPVDDIKRIEVIKGPMSSLYGNKAMLGIINIVTYDPEETRTLLAAGGGMNWMGNGRFINAGKFSDGYWYKVTGNYLRYNDESDFRGTGKQKAEETLSLTGKLQMQPVESFKATLSGDFTSDFGLVQFGGTNSWSERRGMLEGTLSNDFGKWGKLHFQSYWERHAMKGVEVATNQFIFDNIDAELRHSLSFDINKDIVDTLTGGAEYRFVGSDVSGAQSISNFAGFLENELKLFKRIILTGGVRTDYQKNFSGLNVSAYGSTVFLVHPRYTLRLSFGTAFNTPNMIQFFLGAAQPIIPPNTVPPIALQDNLGLKAERILYLDVGNTVRPTDWLTVHGDFFYYRLNNLLQPSLQFSPQGTALVSFVNDGGAGAIGGEISLEAKMSSWLSGFANWSYQQFSSINGNTNQTANMGNPKNKAGAGLTGYWFGKRLTANLNFYYIRHHMEQNGAVNFPNVGAVLVDDFYLLNARVGYWPIKDHLELSVAANNILDDNSTQYPERDSLFNLVLAERPRFNIWGAVRYQF